MLNFDNFKMLDWSIFITSLKPENADFKNTVGFI